MVTKIVVGWLFMNYFNWTSLLNECNELIHNIEINSYIHSLSKISNIVAITVINLNQC